MIQLRPHQVEKSYELASILSNFSIAYLAGEVRSGKTLTALNTASIFNSENVLVITKKKAISSIQNDYKNFKFTYKLTCINYESLHKIDKKNFDLVIYDEAHSLGAYPKKSKRTNLCKKLFKKTPCILMSGTPAVESYSQLYHQLWVSDYSPFKKYTTFYKWANKFVNKKEIKLPTHTVTDYSHAKVKEINEIIKPYFVKMTQQDAGFETKVKEHYLEVKTPDAIDNLAKRLLNDKAIEGQNGFILGDTPAKLQSKVHQIYNGSCIIETASGESKTTVLSKYKANFIAEQFKGKKIAIMYYYQAELDILKATFGGAITTDLETFNTKDVNLAIQQTSTEGINLSKADCLVYYNLGFSGKNYLQSRDRLTVKERTQNDVYYICESGGFTKRILKAVKNKKDYNSKLFMKDYGK